jgi:uncharacterized protein (TIGR00251 family)
VTPTWLRQAGADVVLILHVQPGAKKTEISGQYGDALKIRLAAPPVDGKANDALLAFLAAKLSVARSTLSLESGATSRSKRLRLSNAAFAEVAAKLS